MSRESPHHPPSRTAFEGRARNVFKKTLPPKTLRPALGDDLEAVMLNEQLQGKDTLTIPLYDLSRLPLPLLNPRYLRFLIPALLGLNPGSRNVTSADGLGLLGWDEPKEDRRFTRDYEFVHRAYISHFALEELQILSEYVWLAGKEGNRDAQVAFNELWLKYMPAAAPFELEERADEEEQFEASETKEQIQVGATQEDARSWIESTFARFRSLPADAFTALRRAPVQLYPEIIEVIEKYDGYLLMPKVRDWHPMVWDSPVWGKLMASALLHAVDGDISPLKQFNVCLPSDPPWTELRMVRDAVGSDCFYVYFALAERFLENREDWIRSYSTLRVLREIRMALESS